MAVDRKIVMVNWVQLILIIINFMEQLDKKGISGHFRLEVYRQGKRIYDSGWKKNSTTKAGCGIVSGLFNGVGGYPTFTYLALGTGNTAATTSDTALVAEITDTGLARAQGTATQITTTNTNDTAQITYTWTASGAKTIQEMGLFNAASGTTMAARVVTTSTTVANNDLVIGTYKIKFTPS